MRRVGDALLSNFEIGFGQVEFFFVKSARVAAASRFCSITASVFTQSPVQVPG